jgi:tetratricopeptide (TPR) repeat protein
LQKQNKLDEAATVLKEGLTRVPPEQSLSFLYVALAHILRDMMRPEDANSVLREGLDRIQSSQAGFLIVALSNNLRFAGDYESANIELRKGIERWPTVYKLYTRLAFNLLAENKFGEAEQVLLAAESKIPMPGLFYLALAKIWEKGGDIIKALNGYERAIKIEDHPVSYCHFANFLWRQGKLVEANEKFEQALSFRKIKGYFWPNIYRAYASFLLNIGNGEKARQILAEGFESAQPTEIDNMILKLSKITVLEITASEEDLLIADIEEDSGELRDGSNTLESVKEMAKKAEVLKPTLPEPAPKASINILHISYIHRGANAPVSNQVLLGKLRDDIFRTYSEDNAKLGGDEPRLVPPDIIVVSGDLTQHSDPVEFKMTYEFLEGLLELVGGDRQRVVLVPGNHDVNWELSKKAYTSATEQQFKDQPNYNEPYRQMVKREHDTNIYWRKVNEAIYADRFRPFRYFFDNFYRGTAVEHTYATEREWMHTVYDYSQIFGLVIVGFNSCDEIDHLDRRAFINTDAIYRAEENPSSHAGESGLTRIAVFHHNILSVGHGEDFLDPKYLQILKRHSFDLCLHGHVHTANLDIFDPDRAKVLPVLGAGSLTAPYKDRPPAAPKGYNLIVINREAGGIYAHTRRHDEDHLVWAADYRWDGKPYVIIQPPKISI